MIILRRLTKLFARRDVFPDELKKIYYPILDIKENNEFRMRFKIERTDKFKEQYDKKFF